MNIYTIEKDEEILLKDNKYEVRECIEKMLSDRLGFFVSLQEFDDDDSFEIYVHSDAYDDLEDREIETLDNLGIDEDMESTENILDYLGIDVYRSTESTIFEY